MLMGDCRSPAGTRSKFSQSGGTRREKNQAVSKNNHYLAPRIRPSHLGRNQRGQRQLTVSETWGLNPLHKANQGRPESTLPGHLHSVISVKPTHLSLSANVTWSQCHPFCGISKNTWGLECGNGFHKCCSLSRCSFLNSSYWFQMQSRVNLQ